MLQYNLLHNAPSCLLLSFLKLLLLYKCTFLLASIHPTIVGGLPTEDQLGPDTACQIVPSSGTWCCVTAGPCIDKERGQCRKEQRWESCSNTVCSYTLLQSFSTPERQNHGYKGVATVSCLGQPSQLASSDKPACITTWHAKHISTQTSFEMENAIEALRIQVWLKWPH